MLKSLIISNQSKYYQFYQFYQFYPIHQLLFNQCYSLLLFQFFDYLKSLMISNEESLSQNMQSTTNHTNYAISPSQQEHSLSLVDLNQINTSIIDSCEIKKGKKAKFIKFKEQVDSLYQLQPKQQSQETLAFIALYKNLGKLGDHEDSIEFALQKLSELKVYPHVQIRWIMQLAALKSSNKKHQQSYDLAERAKSFCIQQLHLLEQGQELQQKPHLKQFIANILNIAAHPEIDQIMWLHNQNHLIQDLIKKMKKSFENQHVSIACPFYNQQDFHIANYMTLQAFPFSNFQQPRELNQFIKDLVIYLSISFFTKATEKYYLKDYSQKLNHLKALRIGLYSFEIECNYNNFLVMILADHFGKKMTQINEQNSQIVEGSEMRIVLPKDTKEVSLKEVVFAEE